jgi:hypothetical protein
MKPHDHFHRESAAPKTVVMVEPVAFERLLVSRRPLERVSDHLEWLHDRETDEVFVRQPEARDSSRWGAQQRL